MASFILLILCNALFVTRANLDLVRTLTPVPATQVWHMASQGNIVFACAAVTNSTRGIIAIDLSNPSEPRFLGKLPLNGVATQLAISGQYAFVAAQRRSELGAVHVIDVSDPEHLVLKKSVNSSYSPIRVTVSGDLLFVSDGGMQILDISDH